MSKHELSKDLIALVAKDHSPSRLSWHVVSFKAENHYHSITAFVIHKSEGFAKF